MSLSKISSLSKKNLGKEISVAGWVENIRDHGGVILLIYVKVTKFFKL